MPGGFVNINADKFGFNISLYLARITWTPSRSVSFLFTWGFIMLRQLRAPNKWPRVEHMTSNIVFAHIEGDDNTTVSLEAWRHALWPIMPDWCYKISVGCPSCVSMTVNFRRIEFRLIRGVCIRVALSDEDSVGNIIMTFDDKYTRMNLSLYRSDRLWSSQWLVCTLKGEQINEFCGGLETILSHAVIPGGFHVL